MAATLSSLVLCASGTAKTYEPTRKDDPVPGKCKPRDCSLREAVSAANEDVGKDTVLLGRGTYRIELPETIGDDNAGGDFDVLNKTAIVGKGPKRTRVDGQDLSGVFAFLTFDPRTLKNLTVQRGASSFGGGISIGPSDATIRNVVVKDSNSSGRGGGIASVSPDLELDRVTLRDDEATTRGGGIWLGVSIADAAVSIRNSKILKNDANDGGGIAIDEDDANTDQQNTVTVTGSTIDLNGANRAGGGIASEATELTIKRSTISAGAAAEGAGIDLRPARLGAVEPRVTRISSSTVGPANNASNKAGGIMVDGVHFTGANLGAEPELYMTNSTVALNSAVNEAGGIMGDNLAKVDVENSSIGFNRADISAGPPEAVAGGVYQHSNASFSVDDSVLANNEAVGASNDDDCSATEVFSGAGNAITSMTGCSVSFTTPFNVYSASAIASDLADNGGPTQTLALVPGSAAIGFANDCPKHDQRGKLRPENCDSGSFENKPK